MDGALRVFVCAGEASGDLHAAAALRALQGLTPVEAFGVGGARLEAAGMEVVVSASRIAAVGLSEVWRTVPQLVAAWRRIKRLLRERRPQLAILVDFPDFNLRVAAQARRLGIPVLYYIGPQVWAWRRGRVRTVARRVDCLAVIFPFEVELYRGLGLRVEFVGHPLVEAVRPEFPPQEVRRRLGVGPGQPLVGLLPGSRPSEVRLHLPVMLRAASRIRRRVPDARFLIPLAPTLNPALLSPARAEAAVVEHSYAAMAACDLLVAASGTATLEAALLERPLVVVRRASALTWWVGRALVRVEHLAMVNLLAGRRVVPELWQGEATPDRIAQEACRLLEDSPARRAQLQELRGVKRLLGGPGASRRVAELALELVR